MAMTRRGWIDVWLVIRLWDGPPRSYHLHHRFATLQKSLPAPSAFLSEYPPQKPSLQNFPPFDWKTWNHLRVWLSFVPCPFCAKNLRRPAGELYRERRLFGPS